MNKNYFCKNNSCNIAISRDIVTCYQCLKKFCSQSCCIDHLFKAHGKLSSLNLQKVDQFLNKVETNNNQGEFDTPRLTPKSNINPETEPVKPKSLFIKNGQFLEEVVNNPHYEFQNFELRRDQPLGRGAFGDVITATHKKDNKKYAIKQVFSLIYFNFTFIDQ